MFCSECGTDHHVEDRAAEAAVDREIEIARIQAQRDVDVARINARLARDELETAEAIAETEADAQVESAAAEAEIIAAVLDSGDQEQEPVIIDAPPVDEPEPDPTDDAAPPPVEDHEAADDKPRKRGLGMW